jgi:hypothetical protein
VSRRRHHSNAPPVQGSAALLAMGVGWHTEILALATFLTLPRFGMLHTALSAPMDDVSPGSLYGDAVPEYQARSLLFHVAFRLCSSERFSTF